MPTSANIQEEEDHTFSVQEPSRVHFCQHYRQCDLVKDRLIPEMFLDIKYKCFHTSVQNSSTSLLNEPPHSIYPLPPVTINFKITLLIIHLCLSLKNLSHGGLISQLAYAICTSAMAIKAARLLPLSVAAEN